MSTSSVAITEFSGCQSGAWKIDRIIPIIGEILEPAPCLSILDSSKTNSDSVWTLRGVASHARYTTRSEKNNLVAVQAELGRTTSLRAALIPIKKTNSWWELTQDERREIFEVQSQHIARSMKYLPAIARKLYHSRDLVQPFDFLTWFEFSPDQENSFDDLLSELRSSEEWKYVCREVDIRLTKNAIFSTVISS